MGVFEWTDDMKRAALKDAAKVCELTERVAELEAALRVLSNPQEYPDLAGFHSGVRSVYGQAVYEARTEMAEWMKTRWLAALQESTAEI